MPLIRIQLKPGGATCNHVVIRGESGQTLLVTEIARLRERVSERDKPLVAQIKRVARDTGLTDPALLKTALETRDFDY